MFSGPWKLHARCTDPLISSYAWIDCMALERLVELAMWSIPSLNDITFNLAWIHADFHQKPFLCPGRQPPSLDRNWPGSVQQLVSLLPQHLWMDQTLLQYVCSLPNELNGNCECLVQEDHTEIRVCYSPFLLSTENAGFSLSLESRIIQPGAELFTDSAWTPPATSCWLIWLARHWPQD